MPASTFICLSLTVYIIAIDYSFDCSAILYNYYNYFIILLILILFTKMNLLVNTNEVEILKKILKTILKRDVSH